MTGSETDPDPEEVSRIPLTTPNPLLLSNKIYIERLNNGLYTLQRIALILAELCTKGATGCRERAEKLFRMRIKDFSLQSFLEPVIPYIFHHNPIHSTCTVQTIRFV